MPFLSPGHHSAPSQDMVHGLRWTRAIFEDGTEEIVEDNTSIIVELRDEAHKASLNKMNRFQWHGFTIYLKQQVEYIDDEFEVVDDDTAIVGGSVVTCSFRATSTNRDLHQVAAAQLRLATLDDDGHRVAGVMEDNERHACIQESEDYADMLFQFERQAEELEEIAVFEKAVDARSAFVAKNGRSASKAEAADLAGLSQHSLGPMLLNARYVDSYVEGETKSKQSRHRKKLPGWRLVRFLVMSISAILKPWRLTGKNGTI